MGPWIRLKQAVVADTTESQMPAWSYWHFTGASYPPARRAAPRPSLCFVLEHFLFLGFLVFTANSGAPAPTWPFDNYTGNRIQQECRRCLFGEMCDLEQSANVSLRRRRRKQFYQIKITQFYWRLDVGCISVIFHIRIDHQVGIFLLSAFYITTTRLATNLRFCSSCIISCSLVQPQGQRCRFQHEFYCSFMKGGKGCCDLPWSFDALLSNGCMKHSWKRALLPQFTHRLSSLVDIVHLHFCNVTFQVKVSVNWQQHIYSKRCPG